MTPTLWKKLQARSARNSSPTHCKQVRCRTAFGGTQNAVLNSAMNAEALYERSPSVSDAENWLALGTGALLLIVGASRRSAVGACLAASSVPLLYRGITGRWPDVLNGHLQPDNTRDGARRRARRPRSGIGSARETRRRRLSLLASPREPAAVHDAPRPGDGNVGRQVALGGTQVRPGWPSNGTPRSSTRSRTR